METFPASESAVWRDRRRKLSMLGFMPMEMESFCESRQTSGYGVESHTARTEDRWASREAVEEEELRAHDVLGKKKKRTTVERSRNGFRMGEVTNVAVTVVDREITKNLAICLGLMQD